MARGEKPLFDLEDLLQRYGLSPPNSEVSAPPSSSAPARNPSDHSAFQRKDGCVVVRIFKFHVEYSFIKFCNGLSTPFN